MLFGSKGMLFRKREIHIRSRGIYFGNVRNTSPQQGNTLRQSRNIFPQRGNTFPQQSNVSPQRRIYTSAAEEFKSAAEECPSSATEYIFEMGKNTLKICLWMLLSNHSISAFYTSQLSLCLYIFTFHKSHDKYLIFVCDVRKWQRVIYC